MRLLVTGGAGFIGSHTVDLLVSKGYDVRILDNLQPRVHPNGKPSYISPKAEFIEGDVARRTDLEPRVALRTMYFPICAQQLAEASRFRSHAAVLGTSIPSLTRNRLRGGKHKFADR